MGFIILPRKELMMIRRGSCQVNWQYFVELVNFFESWKQSDSRTYKASGVGRMNVEKFRDRLPVPLLISFGYHHY